MQRSGRRWMTCVAARPTGLKSPSIEEIHIRIYIYIYIYIIKCYAPRHDLVFGYKVTRLTLARVSSGLS